MESDIILRKELETFLLLYNFEFCLKFKTYNYFIEHYAYYKSSQPQYQLNWSMIGNIIHVLKQINIDRLMLFLLCQNSTIEQMDQKYGRNIFVKCLFEKIVLEKRFQFLNLFQKEISLLHKIAMKSDFSIRAFYQNAVIDYQIRTQKSKRNLKLWQFKQNQQFQEFSQFLGKEAEGQAYLNLYRSSIRFAPYYTKESQELSQIMLKNEDLSIFETSLAKHLIKSRLEYCKVYYRFLFMILILNYLIFWLHSCYFRDVLTGIFMILFALISTVQLITNFKAMKCQYFDWWAFIDIFKIPLTIVYFVILIDFQNDGIKSGILTLLSILMSLKLTQIFSFYQGTRVLFRIIIQTMKDMRSFFLVCAIITFSIAASYTSSLSQAQLQYSSFNSTLFHIYLLDYGDFSTDDYNGVKKILFIAASLLVPLVLLNILIAIMGDTYDRVKEDSKTRDLHQAAKLIFQQEKVCAQYKKLLCRKQKQEWEYLFFAQPVKTQLGQSSREWEGRLKSIKNKIVQMQKSFSMKLNENFMNIKQTANISNRNVLEVSNQLEKIPMSLIGSIPKSFEQLSSRLNVMEDKIQRVERMVTEINRNNKNLIQKKLSSGIKRYDAINQECNQ